MKKIISNLLVVALLMGMALTCLSACDILSTNAQTSVVTQEATEPNTEPETEPSTEAETEKQHVHVDYAGSVKLDMSSETVKQEINVKSDIKAFIDGDTTHFYVPTSLMETGFIKARYLAVNTPESTGQIEEWGKAAAAFTKQKLSTAESIIIESDTATLNADSTGDRYLLWIWYKPEGGSDYRNLNIELLQNGLAIASNSAQNRYGKTCMDAINQAKAEKLCVYSGEKDPDFYYGEAQVITLKELRCNIEKYNGTKVAFTGIITMNSSNGVYIESYDEETDVWYGMYIYYGFGMNGQALEIISVGNEARIVGTVSYYETGGTYQVSDLKYSVMKPDDPTNIKKLSDGHSPVYLLTTPEKFVDGKVEVSFTDGEENQVTKTYDYAQLALNSSISMEGLVVKSAYVTDDEESKNYGAMTLTCEANGKTVKVRTTVFKDENGELITKDYYVGKTIDVKGIVDYFSGDYQIKVFTPNDIIIH